MLKLVGVVLVWGGCTVWGIHAGRMLRDRLNQLEEIGQGLELLERELALNAAALPDMLERLGSGENGQRQKVFSICKSELEQGKCFTESWEEALDESILNEREKQLLRSLAGVLGRYDAQGQIKSLTRLRGDWSEHIALVRRQLCSLETVYRAMGVTVGGFVALMLV